MEVLRRPLSRRPPWGLPRIHSGSGTEFIVNPEQLLWPGLDADLN
jgi:hypothetical protein